MSRSTDLLNAVQRFLIDFANREGINLADDFKTVDEFKKFVIAITFKTAVDIGLTVPEALDLTLGDGSYDRLVSEVWEAAQK